MRVLIACEFSGVVRRAFEARGHEAWSCDLLATEEADASHHIQADINLVLNYPDRVLGGCPRWMREAQWDLMIAHPPCTYLANSGVRWLYKGGKGTDPNPDRWLYMEAAARFFEMLRTAKIPKVAVENQIMHGHVRPAIDPPEPDQIIQPWMFGHGETKATCLWLKGLPLLRPTEIVSGRKGRVHHETPSPDRWKNRSRTLPGIAAAMADQWGAL